MIKFVDLKQAAAFAFGQFKYKGVLKVWKF